MQYWKHNTFFIQQACVLAYDYTGSKEEIKTLYLLLSVAHGKRVTGSSRARSWSCVSIIKMACHSLGYSILQDSYSKAQSTVYWELMCSEIPAWSAFLWLWGVVSVSLVSMRIIAHHVSSSSLSQTFRSRQPSATAQVLETDMCLYHVIGPSNQMASPLHTPYVPFPFVQDRRLPSVHPRPFKQQQLRTQQNTVFQTPSITQVFYTLFLPVSITKW